MKIDKINIEIESHGWVLSAVNPRGIVVYQEEWESIATGARCIYRPKEREEIFDEDLEEAIEDAVMAIDQIRFNMK